MMLAEIGHYHAALDDARNARAHRHRARACARSWSSRWPARRWRCGAAATSTDVLDLIDDALALAAEIELHRLPRPAARSWRSRCCGRWAATTRPAPRWSATSTTRNRRLHDERTARWEHVRLGVEHLRVEAISESDPLTGLPNRRHLAHLLPEVLEEHAPVCVGVIDLDGFKHDQRRVRLPEGDSVLQEVAGLLERVLPPRRLRGAPRWRRVRDGAARDLARRRPRGVRARPPADRARAPGTAFPADVRLTASRRRRRRQRRIRLRPSCSPTPPRRCSRRRRSRPRPHHHSATEPCR